MRRELVLIEEMIEAAEQARSLVAETGVAALEADRQRRDALLWNFTVLGEASAQLDSAVKARFPDIEWARPAQLRNRVVHGYWSIDLEILHTTATDQPGIHRSAARCPGPARGRRLGRSALLCTETPIFVVTPAA